MLDVRAIVRRALIHSEKVTVMQDHLKLTAALVVLMSLGTGRSYAAEPATPKRVVAIKAGRLFDGTGDDYRRDVVIVL